MDFDNLFVGAARLVWQRRTLWLLGLLATLGGIANSLFFRLILPFDLESTDIDDLDALYRHLVRPGPIVGFALALIFLGLLFWLVGVAAEGGLIRAAADIQRGRSVSFGEAWGTGRSLLGRFIAIDTLLFFPLFLVLLAIMMLVSGGLIGLLLVASRPNAVAEDLLGPIGLVSALSLPLLCLLAPVGITTMALRIFALRAATLHDLTARPSIRRAWRLLRENLGSAVLIGILLWGIRYLAGMAVGLLLFPLTLASLSPILQLAMGGTDQIGAVFEFLALAAGLLAVLGSGAVTAWLHSYAAVVWTLAYQSWTLGQAHTGSS